jgi:hypothetical protein
MTHFYLVEAPYFQWHVVMEYLGFMAVEPQDYFYLVSCPLEDWLEGIHEF